MAEILLSLTIIGVVAAITLPSLTGNINERTWNTQRKALFARMSQAMSLMPSLNGYGTITEATEDKSAVDTAAEAFITEGLTKVLKINNICDSEHLADCGIPKNITALGGSTINNFITEKNTLLKFNDYFTSTNSYTTPDTKAAAFETQNGESILVYYNPNCSSNINENQPHHIQSQMCANFIYDLNGTKGPNTFGKDIGFITTIYPTDPIVVAPIPLANGEGYTSGKDAISYCKNIDSQSRLPNRFELNAMSYNKTLLNFTKSSGSHVWYSSSLSSNNAWWILYFNSGLAGFSNGSSKQDVRCIKR